jgi:ABC-2 type transport system permease protein
MNKAWLIARHEFLTNVRKRSFLLSAVGIPGFFIGLFYVIFALTFSQYDVANLGTIGYVDQSGLLAAQVDKPETFAPFVSESDARTALDASEIGAFFIVPEDYETTGSITIFGRTDSNPDLHRQITAYLVANLGVAVDPDRLARMQQPVESSVLFLDSGRLLNDESIAGLFIVPLVFVLLFSMGAQVTSGYLMSSVVEEKSNRIMEILVTTVTPFQLLIGKIIGLGAVGLLQLAIWIGAGLIVAEINRDTPLVQGLVIPLDLVVIALVYFVLSYFLQASLMAGIGAVAGGEQESRQIAGILSLVFLLPYFFMISFITDPGGFIPVLFTYIPFTAPVAVIARMAFSTVPLEQIMLSMAILFVTSLLIAWASARIFRWSLLMYGKRPSLRQLVGALRSSTMQTTATGEAQG